MAESLPTGTVTFLFTDIEGSMGVAQRHREAWEAVRARHQAIVRPAVEMHGGHIFQIIGDGFCVAFHTAAEALNAAVEAQRRLQAEDWGKTPIKVRMGINTGAAHAGTKADVSGGYTGYSAMARTQRVMSTAYGGQILLSNTTADLLAGELPEDVALRDMKEHRLKGFAAPLHLWQVVAAGLEQDFPALQTLSIVPNNLPLQLTAFIGRENEVATIKHLVARNRLVTLTGSGGIGKTRHALEVGAEVLDGFKDGVWWVGLASIQDAALVPQAVASALGVREDQARSLMIALQEYVASRQMLLLLDDCEHLLEACAELAGVLLKASPQLHILVTSREALGISGEVTYRVPALAVPNPQRLPSIEEASQYDAVRLFVERATAVKSDFAVSRQNAPAVAQVCSRLDGIPLAIELAAARANALTVEQIAARLDDVFRLLTGGSRTVLPRQRTLQATIDWSYTLLAEDERAVLRRSSVFAGGWALEAAESVCGWGGIESPAVLDLLTHLVAKSLVVAEEQGGVMRFHMLETIRQYAHDRVLEAGEDEQTRRRHFEYYSALGQQLQQEFEKRTRKDRAYWVRLVSGETDNYRVALEWCLASGQGRLALQAAARLDQAWDYMWSPSEGGELGERILAAAPEPSSERAVVLCQLGRSLTSQGNLEGARGVLEQAVSLSESLGDRVAEAEAIFYLSWPTESLGRHEQALQMMERSLVLFREQDRADHEAMVLMMMGEQARAMGDLRRARQMDEASVELLRPMNDELGLLVALGNLGILLIHFGELEKSEAHLREAGALGPKVGLSEYQFIVMGFAFLANARGRALRGARLLGAAAAARKAQGRAIDSGDQADYDANLASLHAQLDEANFNQAWNEGAAMSLDQALAYALEKTD